ncbi:MAG: hypothetical protein AAF431_00330 [Pseudomonadota bacterium]
MSECVCTDPHCKPVVILPGLSQLPRQIATFADFRQFMLANIEEYPALEGWRPCGQDDLGLMLLEMWSYMLDVQSFYDQVLAQESYLRTAQHRPALRKLIALLGYIPRPAVAASATLAVLTGSRRGIDIPVGTGFRSGAFLDEAPQVFETTSDQRVHGLNSQWALAAPVATTVGTPGSTSNSSFLTLLVEPDTVLQRGNLVLISVRGAADSYRQVRTVTEISNHSRQAKQVRFNQPVILQGGFALEDILIRRSTQIGHLWSNAQVGSDPAAVAGSQVVLDAPYRKLISANDTVVITRSGVPRWFRVQTVNDINMTITAAATTTVTVDGDDASIAVPAVRAPVTRLTMQQTVEQSNWGAAAAGMMVLHYGFEEAATVTAEPPETLESDSRLALNSGHRPRLEPPIDASQPQQLLLQDINNQGDLVHGTVDYANSEIVLDGGEQVSGMVSPVTAYGNVLQLSRGESVDHEVIGSGDPTLANQFFKLKKAPLTYLNATTSDNEQGVISTLRIYVDGILWQEVRSFYDQHPDAQVYIVRQDDLGNSIIHFGDGRAGSRLPTGNGNVVAYYRFGAGKAAPPADSISQMVTPVVGVNSVKQVVAAGGGADAESADDIQELAPRSALLLGRAISVDDIKVAAAAVPGVDAAHAEWRWQQVQQRPAVQIWYVGDASVELVLEKVHNLVSPSIAIAAQPVGLFPIGLSIDLELDSNYLADEVLQQVYSLLADPVDGVLVPANVGFDQPLVRSRLFADLLSVPGVVNVDGLLVRFLWFVVPWDDEVIRLPIDLMIDFIAGGITINGQEFVE